MINPCNQFLKYEILPRLSSSSTKKQSSQKENDPVYTHVLAHRPTDGDGNETTNGNENQKIIQNYDSSSTLDDTMYLQIIHNYYASSTLNGTMSQNDLKTHSDDVRIDTDDNMARKVNNYHNYLNANKYADDSSTVATNDEMFVSTSNTTMSPFYSVRPRSYKNIPTWSPPYPSSTRSPSLTRKSSSQMSVTSSMYSEDRKNRRTDKEESPRSVAQSFGAGISRCSFISQDDDISSEIDQMCNVAVDAAIFVLKHTFDRDLAITTTVAVLSTELNAHSKFQTKISSSRVTAAVEASVGVLFAGGSQKTAVTNMVMVLRCRWYIA